ncbi:hypothetical protein AB0I53_30475 [Saccharopolyspora sp. NPDC050389]|uniref:hypothetical protein n=1 Tax=Saccharopolyspora sp. NPDC050389 TaxID=3155516 RepID=UPI0034026D79
MPSETILDLRVGPVTLDVPRSIGYFGGVALAVGVGLIDPPLAAFIAAVPLWKTLNHRALPLAARTAGAILEGASRPIGGDAEGTVRLDDQQEADDRAIAISLEAAYGDQLRGHRKSDPCR